MTGILLLGGFLGSGKTTLMLKLAEGLQSQGFSVSLVTNDQGDDLVDTGHASSLGFDTQEITGGCFCCKFPDLLGTLRNIAEVQNPDYVIAEAVGSCTDLNATVIQPLSLFHSDFIHIAGFWALADGFRFGFTGEYAKLELENPISPLEVLVSHQISESAVVLLSKCDLLTPDEQQAAISRIAGLNPQAEIIKCSATTGKGLEKLIEILKREEPVLPKQIVPLDYDVYAEAEAEYGWYNGSWNLKAGGDQDFDPVDAAVTVLSVLQEKLNAVRAEGVFPIAHAKVQVLTENGSLKAGIAGGLLQAPDIMEMPETNFLKIVVNIRASYEPGVLSSAVSESVLPKLLESFPGSSVTEYLEQTLTPSRPEPTYRINK